MKKLAAFIAACMQMLVGGALLVLVPILARYNAFALAGLVLLAGVSCVYSGMIIVKENFDE